MSENLNSQMFRCAHEKGSFHFAKTNKDSGKKCLNLNAKKTKLMKTDKAKEDLEIKVNGETLEIVSKYVYLGSTISGDGDGMEK